MNSFNLMNNKKKKHSSNAFLVKLSFVVCFQCRLRQNMKTNDLNTNKNDKHDA